METLAHGVVLGGTGGVWQIRTDDGETVDAALRGRLKKSNSGKRADGSLRRDTVAAAAGTLKLAVGDDVRLERGDRDDAWAIAEILPRRSRLARRAPGGGQGERIVAANVDQVVIVFAAAKPDPHPRMLDRFLVIAEGNGLPARIIINKVDLVGEAAARERFDAYERIGYPVHYTAAKSATGVDALRAMLGGRRSVLTGPSGVGKSSLLNTLFPGANLRVGAISESVNKGRHTTVGAVMLPLPGGDGYVIDTPGLREVGLWALPAERLDDCFPELRALKEECRFADCRHVAEPDCAVRDAVASGAVTAERYDSYRRLLEEIETGA
ncbi:MAG TPA: ribosome small subunit-dependent GTPase A [Gemmatimonadaceae bacterium]|jgi:ribosome biogenesis GTPase|nr:ribosome small subunit-dependent GTPase A [Gemmatimonadaceae bacterium]